VHLSNYVAYVWTQGRTATRVPSAAGQAGPTALPCTPALCNKACRTLCNVSPSLPASTVRPSGSSKSTADSLPGARSSVATRKSRGERHALHARSASRTSRSCTPGASPTPQLPCSAALRLCDLPCLNAASMQAWSSSIQVQDKLILHQSIRHDMSCTCLLLWEPGTALLLGLAPRPTHCTAQSGRQGGDGRLRPAGPGPRRAAGGAVITPRARPVQLRTDMPRSARRQRQGALHACPSGTRCRACAACCPHAQKHYAGLHASTVGRLPRVPACRTPCGRRAARGTSGAASSTRRSRRTAPSSCAAGLERPA